ncbi:SO_0444 family Cu/Zn efflux transporter [Alteromonadaceae bacterium BrNp21-10]|nr:SO_0444 family Cu/Zn efflux transporter [Alteromonadaceae bacterium BrNp21-10]
MLLIQNFIELFVLSAPWLLLGLAIAGMMKWMIPMELLQRHMGKNDVASIIKAAIIGAPLPLCSCGVIPAAVGLKRAGASTSATTSFLVATPETGVDSISVSYALLGPFFAIVRPIYAVISAIYTGLLVKWITTEKKPDSATNVAPTQSCCSKKAEPVTPIVESKSCCSSKDSSSSTEPQKLTWLQRIGQAMSFASGKLLEDISLWLIIGLVLAAMIKTWVAMDFLTQSGDGIIAMLAMALIGVPMYICATASTPLAVGFLAAGLSPGAVIVFMLAGPATNISTMGMIRKEMGMPVLWTYIASIFSASIALGYFTNWLIGYFDIALMPTAVMLNHEHVSWIDGFFAIVLALLMARNLLKWSKQRFSEQLAQA